MSANSAGLVAPFPPSAPRILNVHHYGRSPKNLPEGSVYCGRPSPWGNPFKMAGPGGRAACCERFEDWLFERSSVVSAARRLLRGYDLACWCVPARCHCESLLLVANSDALPKLWRRQPLAGRGARHVRAFTRYLQRERCTVHVALRKPEKALGDLYVWEPGQAPDWMNRT